MARLRFDPSINAGAILQLCGLLVAIGGPALLFYGDLRQALIDVRRATEGLGELRSQVGTEGRRLTDGLQRLSEAISPLPLLTQRVERIERRQDEGDERDRNQDRRIGEQEVRQGRMEERLNLLRPPVRGAP